MTPSPTTNDIQQLKRDVKRLRKLLRAAVAFIGAGEVEGSTERWLRSAEKELENDHTPD